MQAVRRKYNLMALVYDLIYRGYVRKTTSVAAGAVALGGAQNILDIGCGTGELEIKLLQKNPNLRIVGIDLSKEMLERAEKKLENHPNVELKEGDFLKTDLPSESFDAAFSLSNLHYFPDPKAIFRKAAAVLKPGGFFVLVDWNRNSFKGKIYNGYMSRMDPAFVKAYTPEEAIQLFQATSFTVEKMAPFNVGLLWNVMLIVAKKT